eukprot:1152131-Pelagomonas_calceolata.AAC.3
MPCVLNPYSEARIASCRLALPEPAAAGGWGRGGGMKGALLLQPAGANRGTNSLRTDSCYRWTMSWFQPYL